MRTIRPNMLTVSFRIPGLGIVNMQQTLDDQTDWEDILRHIGEAEITRVTTSYHRCSRCGCLCLWEHADDTHCRRAMAKLGIYEPATVEQVLAEGE